MSNKMPVISGRKLVKILKKKGFSPHRKPRSHIIMTNGDLEISVPDHKELHRKTLMDILKQTNITKEELVELLKKI